MSTEIRRIAVRIAAGKFCKLEVTLTTGADGKERLSICGVSGVVKARASRHDEQVGTAPDGKVLVGECFGQVTEDISKFFPEARPWLPFHLNDMRAECAHQRARGETWKTHPSAQCPECGYKLGHAWLYEALPEGARAWVESVPSLASK